MAKQTFLERASTLPTHPPCADAVLGTLLGSMFLETASASVLGHQPPITPRLNSLGRPDAFCGPLLSCQRTRTRRRQNPRSTPASSCAAGYLGHAVPPPRLTQERSDRPRARLYRDTSDTHIVVQSNLDPRARGCDHLPGSVSLPRRSGRACHVPHGVLLVCATGVSSFHDGETRPRSVRWCRARRLGTA